MDGQDAGYSGYAMKIAQQDVTALAALGSAAVASSNIVIMC